MTDTPMLAFEELAVSFGGGRDGVRAVDGVSLTVAPGEVVAVVGESGSGKSVTSMSALGLLPPTATTTGTVRVGGVDVTTLDGARLRTIRGAEVAMVFQEPMTALNPAFTVGWQVAEALRLHIGDLSKKQALERAAELLETVGIRDARDRLGQYPHELSGGLRQRVVIAMAIACEPKVLIADEATTALDVTVQAEILDLLRDLRARFGMAMLVITHNMGVVADIADRVVVMYQGKVVEQATVEDLFARPQADYTKKLLASVPRLARGEGRTRTAQADEEVALSLEHLVVEFRGKGGRKNRAVDDVSLTIAKGEVLGLVGESGSGKSTVGRAAIGLLKPTSGSVRLLGEALTDARGRDLRRLRRRCGIVFQDPASSLDPRMTVGDCVAEPLVINGVGDRTARVVALLKSVELDPALRRRHPHELSGGQRQRVGIARALALDPQLVIADEPTSALDVSVQAAVLKVFLELQQRLGFACLFITHDLAVVGMVSDRVAVMKEGRLVEVGPRDEVLFDSREDYTRRLVTSAPVPDPVDQRRRREERHRI
ncbi:ABC transporter ATP-binding protein [Actinoallomurus bryophytorum]|uniref:Peptide/nickel transport system ATP-binding protein n=1 Tax=Actinoallomurus bryophytorum TaxID=1490222 RepID=A0A543CMS5_9ACTN|nr:ABC transporter ATP-binding protein [Actinoallomurus bryophytorum]TQL98415.1 peptide/nickel transport system ATP-binding protein [Actinoallomurus bryophytorum]